MKKRICSILLMSIMICAAASGCGGKAEQPSSLVESIAENAELDEDTESEFFATADASGDFIDLTSMGKDMVYATVFQMMM